MKYKSEQFPVTNNDAYPLCENKNSKAVIKKPIVWLKDSEMKAQGQNTDCGTDLSSIEEGELMDCEFRDDALGHKKDHMKKL